MYPGTFAQSMPDKPATIMSGSGLQQTFGELNDRSNQLAQLMWAAGLREGDHVAIYMENCLEFLECYWAATRSGLYFTTINRYLQADEAAYILNDSASRVLFTSARMAERAAELPALAPTVEVLLSVDGGVDGFDDYETEMNRFSAEPLEYEPRGEIMLYSSGTTGQPKGIKRPLVNLPIEDPAGMSSTALLLTGLFGVDQDSVYLSPAPMYHTAPLAFSAAMQGQGATVVMMENFDAAEALAVIERYRVTHSQWVPTMFSRMLKLPEEQRTGYDWSSHRCAIHAAAPCPAEVKHQMFDLWGPIINEYYAGTEANGFTFCGPEDWLAHPGTVGRSLLGPIHICDELGKELPHGDSGTIYFEREEMPFEYHNAPEKTRAAQHPEHSNWSTLGDVGYLDEEGFLYLTDRKAFMIIAGGVNIYPQEIEDLFIVHPKVADVAVIGVPNEDLGEEVKAIIQPEAGTEPDAALRAELLAYAVERLARYKVPRSIDFRAELPRLPTGKLYKRLLRDEYWADAKPTSS